MSPEAMQLLGRWSPQSGDALQGWHRYLTAARVARPVLGMRRDIQAAVPLQALQLPAQLQGHTQRGGAHDPAWGTLPPPGARAGRDGHRAPTEPTRAAATYVPSSSSVP